MLCYIHIIIAVVNSVTSLGAEAGRRTLTPTKDPTESPLQIQLYSQAIGMAK